jgi:hypothetical protein
MLHLHGYYTVMQRADIQSLKLFRNMFPIQVEYMPRLLCPGRL